MTTPPRSVGLIADSPPDSERSAMIERAPVSDAARLKSTCPPTAPMCTPRRSSAPTWPSRSTSIAELIDTSDLSCDSTDGAWV